MAEKASREQSVERITFEGKGMSRLPHLTGAMVGGVVVFACLLGATLAATAEDGSDVGDRLAIQETLLSAYAYTWDSKDCSAWAHLFTTDALLALTAQRVAGRDAIREYCVTRQRTELAEVKTRHNMTNTVFDTLTPTRAEARTYVLVTWKKPTDPAPILKAALTYRDVIVKQDGRWLFRERHFQ